jgi:hypothetical protein
VLEGAEFELIAQSRQAVAASAAAAYLLAGHKIHTEEPLTGLCDPARQAPQLVPSSPVKPVLQMQNSFEVLPMAELLLAWQSMHCSAAEYCPYLPAAHLTQDEAPGLAEYVPAWHSAQSTDELDPMMLLAFPAGHMEQVEAPAESPNVPAAHSSQSDSTVAPGRGPSFPTAQDKH